MKPGLPNASTTHGMAGHARGPIKPYVASTDEGRDPSIEHSAELSFQDFFERAASMSGDEVLEDSANVRCASLRAGSAPKEAAACSTSGPPQALARGKRSIWRRFVSWTGSAKGTKKAAKETR